MLSLRPFGAPGVARSNVRLAPPCSRWSFEGSPLTKRSVSTKYTACAANGSVVPTYSGAVTTTGGSAACAGAGVRVAQPAPTATRPASAAVSAALRMCVRIRPPAR